MMRSLVANNSMPLLNEIPSCRKVTYDYKRFLRAIQSGDIFKLGKQKKHISNFIDEALLKEAIFVNQEPPAGKYNDDEKFEMAEELLKKYARAKLVITSRIHCALPCLAMGTPVIFVNGFDSFVDSCRFDGILELFNRIDFDTKDGSYTSNFGLQGKITKDTKVKNLEKHHVLAEPMKELCRNFIKNG
ncbi:MAG: hypothetical protein EOO02_17785 [Chitinophagaceae bacterium]|nr:MAG: hypothetical protein EOO02_17785 [Chitinophagaceae bacterium]